MTQLVNIVQISKSCDQTDNGTQNAQRRRIRARLREHRTSLGVTLLHDRELGIQNITDKIRIHTVDDHAKTRAEERILNLLCLALKREDTLTTCNLRQLDELLHEPPFLLHLRNLTSLLDQVEKISQLLHVKPNEQTRERSANDDEERSRIIERRQRRPFQDHANKDRDKPHENPDDR